MSNRRKLSRLVVVSLLVAGASAPAALAQPVDPPSVHKEPMAQQDLRTENATGGAKAPVARSNIGSDMRTENARDSSRAPKAPVGLPTWPLDPQPLVPVAQQPVVDGGDGGDIDWPVAALALAGALLLGGSVGVAGARYRATHSHAAG